MCLYLTFFRIIFLSAFRSTTVTPTPITDPCKPDRHNEYFSVPEDCHSFFVCSFGTTYKFRCAGTTVFYPTKNVCDINDGTIQCWWKTVMNREKKCLQFIFTWFLTFTLSCKFYHLIYIFIYIHTYIHQNCIIKMYFC